jgi:endonuclease/exonuclease/phosphatase family metal-dependent hydrolase
VPEAPPPSVRLRVMSYNIQAGRGIDHCFDLMRTAVTIEAQRPDLLALQEVDVAWSSRSEYVDEAAWLSRRLNLRSFFAPIYTRPPDRPGAPTRRFGLAILSRFPIISTTNHLITRMSTQEPDAEPVPTPGFPEVVVDVAGRPLRIFNAHLDFRPDPAVRRTQVDEIASIIGDRPGLLAGDFNAPPGAGELAPLWNELTDPLDGDCFTWPADRPAKRFDYVAVPAGITVQRARVAASLASDHLPVVADLFW